MHGAHAGDALPWDCDLSSVFPASVPAQLVREPEIDALQAGSHRLPMPTTHEVSV